MSTPNQPPFDPDARPDAQPAPPTGAPLPAPGGYPPPAAPGYGAAPYGPSGHPGYTVPPTHVPPTHAAPTPPRSGQGLGVTAVILGAVPLFIGIIQPFAVRSLLSTDTGYALYSAVVAVVAVFTLAFGVAALVCGLVARRRAPLLGGVGIGLGAAATIGTLSGFLYSLPFLY